jgi:hypothetical protein
MTTGETGEHDVLGRELILGIEPLILDALLRSDLPVDDTTYSAVAFVRDHAPDEEIVLEINTATEDEYGVTLSERPRTVESDPEKDDTFDTGTVTGLVMGEDGTDLRFRNTWDTGGMSLAEAASHIVRRLPDFNGAAAIITVQTEVEVEEAH